MSDLFIVKHNVTNEFVLVKRGVQGYFGVSIHTQKGADEFNKEAGNTAALVKAALVCSMFGWDSFDELIGTFAEKASKGDLLLRTHLAEALIEERLNWRHWAAEMMGEILMDGWVGYADYTLKELVQEYVELFDGSASEVKVDVDLILDE